MTVTIHWIGEDWKYNSLSLDTFAFPLPHTGKALAAEALLSVLQPVITVPIAAIVTDNASSNIAGFRDHFHRPKAHLFFCAAHTVQLYVLEALAHDSVHPLLEKVRELTRFYRKSGKALQALHTFAGDTFIKPKLDEPTRVG